MGVDLFDNCGLICGFWLPADGPGGAVEFSAIDTAQPPQVPVWLHFNKNDGRSREWLARCAWIPPEARDTLIGTDRGIHIEALGEGIVGTLADVFADDPEEMGVLHLFADARCLITSRQHPMSAVAGLRGQLVDGHGIGGTAAALLRLTTLVVTSFGKLVTAFCERVDEAEDQVFAGQYRDANLGQHRRAMARLRRHVQADRHALTDLLTDATPWWDKTVAKNLRRTVDRLATVGQELELAEERARLLTEEIDSRLTERTNRNLYFVSLAAAVFLPITLISGIFGMNVGGLPWEQVGDGFLSVMLLMGVAVIVIFALLYWRRML